MSQTSEKKWKKLQTSVKKGKKVKKQKKKKKKERTEKEWQISKNYTKLCIENYLLQKITHPYQNQV